jgi:hypothetical protein
LEWFLKFPHERTPPILVSRVSPHFLFLALQLSTCSLFHDTQRVFNNNETVIATYQVSVVVSRIEPSPRQRGSPT